MSIPASPPTVTELLAAQAESPRLELRFEDRQRTWRDARISAGRP